MLLSLWYFGDSQGCLSCWVKEDDLFRFYMVRVHMAVSKRHNHSDGKCISACQRLGLQKGSKGDGRVSIQIAGIQIHKLYTISTPKIFKITTIKLTAAIKYAHANAMHLGISEQKQPWAWCIVTGREGWPQRIRSTAILKLYSKLQSEAAEGDTWQTLRHISCQVVLHCGSRMRLCVQNLSIRRDLAKIL